MEELNMMYSGVAAYRITRCETFNV